MVLDTISYFAAGSLRPETHLLFSEVALECLVLTRTQGQFSSAVAVVQGLNGNTLRSPPSSIARAKSSASRKSLSLPTRLRRGSFGGWPR